MKQLLLILTFVALGNVALAQVKPEDSRLEALKIAYITRKLNLSSEEAQRFWPIYNAYAGEMKKVRQERNADVVDREERMVDIRKQYRDEFGRALPKDKVNNFFRAEHEFGTYLRQELEQRRMQRQGGAIRRGGQE